MDNLHKFVSDLSIEMDILAITETSEKEDTGFLNNVEIEGYEIYHTASKSPKGGTAIFVNKSFDKVERCDLNINNIELETTWIEIKNKKSKNIVCGNIYRHPVFSILKGVWVNYLKKIKYIRGDFNFDLLKIDTDHKTQHF